MVHLFYTHDDYVGREEHWFMTTNFRLLVAMKKPFGAAHALPLLASGFIYRMQDGGLV